MSGSKHVSQIAWIVTALMLALTLLFMQGASFGIELMAHTMGYEDRLFDSTKVHTLDLVMEDWDAFLASAMSEEYYAADVTIDGESYRNVGIRAKGNTSLSTVASLGSERYSFKIEFDHYDSARSYYGLDKLSLNNLIQDATMMKDYLTYTLMNAFGVHAPLCSYVYITVNGEDWGLYLAVEGVEEAFLERQYGTDYGALYKPDSMNFGGGRGNGQDFDMADFELFAGGENGTDGENAGWSPSAMPGGGMPTMPSSQGGSGTDGASFPFPGSGSAAMGADGAAMPEGGSPGEGFSFDFGMGSSDVKLQYIDDELESYTNIWNSAKTAITTADQYRLIESLQKLSNGEEIEAVVDIDQVLRYFVVHNYVCNDDSYTGMMVHNYYLYEQDGQLAMIPWDYNLAFGTFTAGDATDTVNTPIDNPVSGGSADRPMLNWIFEDAQYTELYHQYFETFLRTVDIEGIIDEAYRLIQPYVAKDPTAFYTEQAFELGVETLRQFCTMRSESIALQLENGETTDNMRYVDASSITLADMGSMNGGTGGFGGMPDLPGMSSERDPVDADGEATPASDATGSLPEAGTGSASGSSAGEDDSEMAPPDLPDNGDPTALPEDFANRFSGSAAGDAERDEPAAPSAGGDAETDGGGAGRPGGMSGPGGDFGFNAPGGGSSTTDPSGWIAIAVSVLILAAGLVIAKRYRH